jgi:Lar family restriction alleviation protein
MNDLKLCPFCGCHDRRVGIRKMGKTGYKVICSRCGSSGPYVRIADFPDKMDAQEEAKRAWNRRANNSDKIISELQKKQEEQRELYMQTGRDEHILAMGAYAYSEKIVKGGGIDG